MAIKSKGNIDLSIRDMILRLLDELYILDLIMNFINTIRLWHNGIGVYSSRPAKLSFSRKNFTYIDNMKDQLVILWQSKEQSVFKITKPIIDLKI